MRSVSEIRQQLIEKQEMLDAQAEQEDPPKELTAKEYLQLAKDRVRNQENLTKAREARLSGKQKKLIIDDSPVEPSELGPVGEAERDDDGNVPGTVSDAESAVPGTVSVTERPQRRDSFRSETDSK